jgi:hypothetical protein
MLVAIIFKSSISFCMGCSMCPICTRTGVGQRLRHGSAFGGIISGLMLAAIIFKSSILFYMVKSMCPISTLTGVGGKLRFIMEIIIESN